MVIIRLGFFPFPAILVVEDATHMKSKEIYGAYEILVNHLKAEGYVLNSGFSWRDCLIQLIGEGIIGSHLAIEKWNNFWK